LKFIAAYFGAALVYFAGGYIYNYKVYGLSGREAFPHSQFWFVDLHGLVTDGCYFSLDLAKVLSPTTSITVELDYIPPPPQPNHFARQRHSRHYTPGCTSAAPGRTSLILPNMRTLVPPHLKPTWIKTEDSKNSVHNSYPGYGSARF
jgi:hypothetical protein